MPCAPNVTAICSMKNRFFFIGKSSLYSDLIPVEH